MTTTTARWTKLASSSRLQRSSQSISVLGSQVIIFGGELEPRQPVDNQIDLVQLGRDQETAASTVAATTIAPSPRVGSSSAIVHSDLYLFSGRGGLAMMPVEENGGIWRFQSASSTWDLVAPADPSAPFPAGRSYHAMASDGSENIFLHAGCPEKGRLSDLWRFNTSANVWTELPGAPAPARGGTSLAYHAGKLYRMNGFDGQREQGGAIDVFDLDSSTWSTISFSPDGSQGPEPRSVCALLAVSLGGRNSLVTLFGERDPSSLGHAGAGKMLGDVWMYDIEAGQWAELRPEGESPPPRGWFDADVATLEGGTMAIVVHGGLAEDNSRLGDVWMLSLK